MPPSQREHNFQGQWPSNPNEYVEQLYPPNSRGSSLYPNTVPHPYPLDYSVVAASMSMNSTWRPDAVPDATHLGLGEMYSQQYGAAPISPQNRDAPPQPSGHSSALYGAPPYIPRETAGVGAELPPNRAQPQSSYFSALPPNRPYGQQIQYSTPSESEPFSNNPNSTPAAPMLTGRYPSFVDPTASQTQQNGQKGKRSGVEHTNSSPSMDIPQDYRDIAPGMDYEKVSSPCPHCSRYTTFLTRTNASFHSDVTHVSGYNQRRRRATKSWFCALSRSIPISLDRPSPRHRHRQSADAQPGGSGSSVAVGICWCRGGRFWTTIWQKRRSRPGHG